MPLPVQNKAIIVTTPEVLQSEMPTEFQELQLIYTALTTFSMIVNRLDRTLYAAAI